MNLLLLEEKVDRLVVHADQLARQEIEYAHFAVAARHYKLLAVRRDINGPRDRFVLNTRAINVLADTIALDRPCRSQTDPSQGDRTTGVSGT